MCEWILRSLFICKLFVHGAHSSSGKALIGENSVNWRKEEKMTNAITKAGNPFHPRSPVLPSGIFYAWFAWEEILGNTPACRCIEFLRWRSASVSYTCATTFPRVYAMWECSRCVQPRRRASSRDGRRHADVRCVRPRTEKKNFVNLASHQYL